MVRFKALTNIVAGLMDWLCGCAHSRTTFPITLPAGIGAEGRKSAPAETYIVCLDCGRHFAYDWSAMRTTRRLAWVVEPALLPVLSGATRELR